MQRGFAVTVIFCCPKCGAGYQAKQERHAFLGLHSFDCQVCKGEVHSWSGAFDYVDWEAVEVMRGVAKG
jgi:hypothetical protein